jgi:hypothetical protein
MKLSMAWDLCVWAILFTAGVFYGEQWKIDYDVKNITGAAGALRQQPLTCVVELYTRPMEIHEYQGHVKG